jgi:hypothetical protein
MKWRWTLRVICEGCEGQRDYRLASNEGPPAGWLSCDRCGPLSDSADPRRRLSRRAFKRRRRGPTVVRAHPLA